MLAYIIMSSKQDAYIYETSMMPETGDIRPFTKRQVTVINDSNANNYLSPLTFSSQSASGNGMLQDWKNATLELPILLVMSGTGAEPTSSFNNEASPQLLSLKNGFHQLIHGMEIKMNGIPIKPRENLENMYVSYKLHETMTWDDIKLHGATTGVYPDSSETALYRSVATAGGCGSTNNNSYQPVINKNASGTISRYNKANEGFVKRQEYISSEVRSGFPTVADGDSFTVLRNDVQTTATYVAHRFIATIRLKDYSDFFQNLPLTLNTIMDISCVVNQVSFNVRKVATGANLFNATPTDVGANDPTWRYEASSWQGYSGATTNPVMIASTFGESATVGNASTYLVANGANSTFTVSCCIQKSLHPAHSAVPGWSIPCRLLLPQYVPETEALSKYLSSPVKSLSFNDFMLKPILNVPSQQFFQYQLAQGVSNLRKLVICPIISSTVNGSITADVTNDLTVANAPKFSPIQSPWASEPGCCSPLGGLFREINCKVNNQVILAEPYRFQKDMFAEIGDGLNGNLEYGLSSGIISREMFERNYCYYVFNLARGEKNTDSLKSAIDIQGYLQTIAGLSVDLYCFILYEKQYELDVSTSVIKSKNW